MAQASQETALSSPASAVGRFSSAVRVLAGLRAWRCPETSRSGPRRPGSAACWPPCLRALWSDGLVRGSAPASLPGVGVGACQEGLQCPAFSLESRDRDVSRLR